MSLAQHTGLVAPEIIVRGKPQGPDRRDPPLAARTLGRSGAEGDLMELNGGLPRRCRARSARARHSYDRIMDDAPLSELAEGVVPASQPGEISTWARRLLRMEPSKSAQNRVICAGSATQVGRSKREKSAFGADLAARRPANPITR